MEEKNGVLYLVLRYGVLVLLGLFNLRLFYLIFTPLTVFPVYRVLSLIDPSSRLLGSNLIFFSGFYAEIIPACVAGAAYYLLFIFNLTTPMQWSQRWKSLLFLVFSFLFLNILRILVFAGLLSSGFQYFDVAHKLTWYFGSTVMVVIVWFVNVWIFKIKNIPIYTDMKDLFEEVTFAKERAKEKKK